MRQSILGPKGALLLFYRPADWCPYCTTQLVDLQSRMAELGTKGFGVAAISYDPQPILAAFSQQHGITFPLLSDVGSVTIKRFGILKSAAIRAQKVTGPQVHITAYASDPAVAPGNFSRWQWTSLRIKGYTSTRQARGTTRLSRSRSRRTRLSAHCTSITLNGVLSYQACDDRVCFNPTTVPLTWELGLRPIVTERTMATPK